MALPTRNTQINEIAGIEVFRNGGPGSGNFDHAGRPGEVGGSAPEGSGGKSESSSDGAKTIDDRLKKVKDMIAKAKKMSDEDFEDDDNFLADVYDSAEDRKIAKKAGVDDKYALDEAEAEFLDVTDGAENFGYSDVADDFDYESLSSLDPKDVLKVRKTYLEAVEREVKDKK